MALEVGNPSLVGPGEGTRGWGEAIRAKISLWHLLSQGSLSWGYFCLLSTCGANYKSRYKSILQENQTWGPTLALLIVTWANLQITLGAQVEDAMNGE